jgi:hypothetical protein
MRKFILPFIILLFLQTAGFGQRFTKFTHEQETFLDEMKALFARDETNYKKGKKLLEDFEEPWLNGGISEYRQERIYELSNLLLKRRARNFPHFYNFINTVLLFQQTNLDTLDYNEWDKTIVFLCTKRKSRLTDINNYITASYNLVKYNAVYYSNSIKWLADKNNYKIILDGDTAKFIFSDIILTGKLRKDSIQIHETSGTYYPVSKIWIGNSAKVYWEKAGLSRDTVWAEFNRYKLKITKASYIINNVTFYNKNYFDYPLKGKLTDKIVEVINPKNLKYPKFYSSETKFNIENIFKDINYQGGISMQGSKLLGTGSKENLASLSFYRDIKLIRGGDTIIKKVLFMKTLSQFYAFSQNNILSRNCKIIMHIDDDSIYHPGLLFRYYNKNREVHLIRNGDPKNMSLSPYYDTYHKIEMDFELLKWQMDNTYVDLTMLKGSSINIANFESQNYFSAERYYEVQGRETLHPYISIRRFSRQYNTINFYDEDLAKFMGYSLPIIQRMLTDFTYTGIVDYDIETGFCTIKPKLFKYLDDIVGKKDYDLIKFESRISAPKNNAILNLSNMDLVIEGVKMINVSDSQNVKFYPTNDQLLFKKNRNFDFSGKIEAGFFTFYGQNFQFKYDSFKIVLNNIDSLTIKVKAGIDNWGRQILKNVENSIEDVTGDLLIDNPNNKSGIKKYPKYPIFTSKKNSYVYYDKKNIQKGKYTRDKFYFVVDPYVIDSLNNYTTEGMGYTGILHSADIFPNIRETLVLQPDNSLGFHHQTPDEGLPAFKGKGQYYSDIHLSNRGLRGNGKLTYLTSTTLSDNFIFYPDSANTNTTSFNIEKLISAVQYPEVKAEKVYWHWMPYLDELHTKTTGKQIVMYEDKAKYSGKLLYTSGGLTGDGISSYNDGLLSSNLFTFNADRFNADTANFKLKSINQGNLAITTENIRANVDFIAMKSEFKSNTGTSQVILPENLYHAYVEKLTWFMSEKDIKLSTLNTVQIIEHGKTRIVSREDAGLYPKGSMFVSVHSGQDSLNWVSEDADFDIATNTMFAHKVKFIDVADATIIPNEGEVTVEPKAYIRTLLNAKLIANRENKYHHFHSSTINIQSRKKYHGEGVYEYYDELGQIQPIRFNLIAVDSTGQTFAKGKVIGIDDFSLSPAFAYQGRVFLEARKKFLYFKGYTKINHECDNIKESWLNFETEINPKNIFIPISKDPQDINDVHLVSGTMLATDSIHIFPAFVSPRKRYSNKPVMTADGFLTYNKKEKTYIIGSKERITDPDTTGNILTLHKNYCQIYGEGKIDLTADLGQIKIQTAGNGIYKLDEDKFGLNLLMTVNFYFPDACMKFIADTLATMTALRPVDLKSRTYIKGVKELIPYKDATVMFNEQSIFGTVKKIPEQLDKTFVFSDLYLKWNKKLRMWISNGKLGIANVAGTQINRKVNGYLAITRRRSGDSFDLYIEISKDHWYYFHYKRGLMQAYSSEAVFNDIIANIKGNDRKLKIQRGEASYVFFLSNEKKRNEFLELIGKKVKDTKNENKEDENIDYEKYDDFD